YTTTDADKYYSLTTSSSPCYGNGNGRLDYLFVGTTQGSSGAHWARLNLNYSYDSGVYPELSRRGNVTRHYDNSGYFSFSYDSQNRLTNAYGKSYLYDSAGRLTDYEGFGYSSYDGHVIKKSGYTYDANGNLISRAGRTLTWNHENRLQYYYQIKKGS
ncbi:MAG: hypothetical protein KDE19_10865, partial [Caldilineaceae bacterium]|nr:hypothetical protein [Caldilineaceae bacterium]